MKFTIITACYKGKDFLPRAYKSLLQQNCHNHEIQWVIVDDYSNDNNQTQDVIDFLKNKAPFPIDAIFLEKNYYGSKCTYMGATRATGDYCILLDQDDMLTPDALKLFAEYIVQYGGKSDFAGICGRCVDLSGRLIGTPFLWEEKLATEFQIRHNDKIRGELFQCTKTEYILKYFKELKKGYTNGWVWSHMAMNYKFVYISKVVRIYDTTNTASGSNRGKTQILYADRKFEQLTKYFVMTAEYFKKAQVDRYFFLMSIAQWCRLGIHLNKTFKEFYYALPVKYHSLLYVAFFLGLFKAKQDKRASKAISTVIDMV